jgi:hypothetical protein
MMVFKYLPALFFMLLVACGESRPADKPVTPEIPKAFKEDRVEIRSYKRSGDLVEELYSELVTVNPALNKLEDDLAAFRPRPGELKTQFGEYDHKSIVYYQAVNNKVRNIKDSLLRTKMIALIAASKNQYTGKTGELNALLKQIEGNSAALNDHHTILKIMLTLPVMEQYQDEHKPDKKEFNKVIKEQERLILQTDSVTPK